MSQPTDPYASPNATAQGSELVASRSARPTAVVVATIAAALTIAFGAVQNVMQMMRTGDGWLGLLITVPLGALILLGVWRGHRLAWQWGRVAGILSLLAVGLAVAGIAGESRLPDDVRLFAMAFGGAQAVVLLTMVISLSRPSAYGFYGLVCPRCGKQTTAAADFFFRKAKCKGCQVTF